MNNIITIIIIAGVTVSLLVFLRWETKKYTKVELGAIFTKSVKNHGLFIHYKDVFNKRLIAFDKINRKLLLIDLKNNQLAVCIDMDEIDSSSIAHLNDGSAKVFLEMVHKKTKDPIRFYFYDGSCDDAQKKTDLLMKARHWNQRINFHKRYSGISSEEYVL